MKSKFDSVNKDDGEFEQHLSNLIEDLDAHEHSIATTNEPKIKDWSNVCGICGKKFKFAARMKTHQRVKCGVEGSVPLEDALKGDEPPSKKPRLDSNPQPKKSKIPNSPKTPIECGKCDQIFEKNIQK